MDTNLQIKRFISKLFFTVTKTIKYDFEHNHFFFLIDTSLFTPFSLTYHITVYHSEYFELGLG